MSLLVPATKFLLRFLLSYPYGSPPLCPFHSQILAYAALLPLLH